MFFTRIGRVVAILALVFGVLYFTLGALIFAQGIEQAIYGRMIERGIIIAFFGIVLGVLTEIRQPPPKDPS